MPAKPTHARAFMRREHYEEPETSPDSPWRQFVVKCLRCGSAKLRLGVECDDGETLVFLACDRCQKREAISVR